MKILVVTGSPRKGGNSDMLADAFIEGATKAGHEIRRIDAGRSYIKPCNACMSCLTNGGDCVQNDDMTDYYEDTRWADTVVYAAPMYFYSYPAQLKAFMDRQFCAIGGKPFGFKQAVLLLVFEDKDMSTADGFVKSFEIAMDYCHIKVAGKVLCNATFEKGAIAGKPALDEARALGENLQPA